MDGNYKSDATIVMCKRCKQRTFEVFAVLTTEGDWYHTDCLQEENEGLIRHGLPKLEPMAAGNK